MRRVFPFLLLAVALLPGCGYRLATPGGGERLRVAVAAVEDRSREPLFGALVRQALTDRGVGRADVTVAADPAAPSLKVTLKALEETPAAFNATNLPREYLLVARADASFDDAGAPDHKSPWKARDLTARRFFPAGDDVDATRRNKDRALLLLADDLAGEILRAATLARRSAPAGTSP